MNTVIVTGPQGCGKTRNAEALRRHLGCGFVMDGWSIGDRLNDGALHLTNQHHDAVAHAHAHAIATGSVLLMKYRHAIADMGSFAGLPAR